MFDVARYPFPREKTWGQSVIRRLPFPIEKIDGCNSSHSFFISKRKNRYGATTTRFSNRKISRKTAIRDVRLNRYFQEKKEGFVPNGLTQHIFPREKRLRGIQIVTVLFPIEKTTYTTISI